MIYDYKCSKCDNVFEITCKMSEVHYKWACPRCHGTNCERHHSSMPMAIPPERIGRMKTPQGFKDVLKNMSEKAIGGNFLKEKI